MSEVSKRKVTMAFTAVQFGAAVAIGFYLAYSDGLRDGKVSSKESVGSDLPADSDGDSDSPPKSTSLDGE